MVLITLAGPYRPDLSHHSAPCSFAASTTSALTKPSCLRTTLQQPTNKRRRQPLAHPLDDDDEQLRGQQPTSTAGRKPPSTSSASQASTFPLASSRPDDLSTHPPLAVPPGRHQLSDGVSSGFELDHSPSRDDPPPTTSSTFASTRRMSLAGVIPMLPREEHIARGLPDAASSSASGVAGASPSFPSSRNIAPRMRSNSGSVRLPSVSSLLSSGTLFNPDQSSLSTSSGSSAGGGGSLRAGRSSLAPLDTGYSSASLLGGKRDLLEPRGLTSRSPILRSPSPQDLMARLEVGSALRRGSAGLTTCSSRASSFNAGEGIRELAAHGARPLIQDSSTFARPRASTQSSRDSPLLSHSSAEGANGPVRNSRMDAPRSQQQQQQDAEVRSSDGASVGSGPQTSPRSVTSSLRYSVEAASARQGPYGRRWTESDPFRSAGPREDGIHRRNTLTTPRQGGHEDSRGAWRRTPDERGWASERPLSPAAEYGNGNGLGRAGSARSSISGASTSGYAPRDVGYRPYPRPGGRSPPASLVAKDAYPSGSRGTPSPPMPHLTAGAPPSLRGPNTVRPHYGYPAEHASPYAVGGAVTGSPPTTSPSSSSNLSPLPHRQSVTTFKAGPQRRVRKRENEHHQNCLGCDATETPEWRKGPTGPRTLCNACGLAYAKMLRRRHQQATIMARNAGLAPPSKAQQRELSEAEQVGALEEIRAAARARSAASGMPMPAPISVYAPGPAHPPPHHHHHGQPLHPHAHPHYAPHQAGPPHAHHPGAVPQHYPSHQHHHHQQQQQQQQQPLPPHGAPRYSRDDTDGRGDVVMSDPSGDMTSSHSPTMAGGTYRHQAWSTAPPSHGAPAPPPMSHRMSHPGGGGARPPHSGGPPGPGDRLPPLSSFLGRPQ